MVRRVMFLASWCTLPLLLLGFCPTSAGGQVFERCPLQVWSHGLAVELFPARAPEMHFNGNRSMVIVFSKTERPVRVSSTPTIIVPTSCEDTGNNVEVLKLRNSKVYVRKNFTKQHIRLNRVTEGEVTKITILKALIPGRYAITYNGEAYLFSVRRH